MCRRNKQKSLMNKNEYVTSSGVNWVFYIFTRLYAFKFTRKYQFMYIWYILYYNVITNFRSTY